MVPIHFVVSFFCLLLLVQAWLKGERSSLLLGLLLICSMQSLSVGFRFGLQVDNLRVIQPLMATTLAVLAFLCFHSLTRHTADGEGDKTTALLWLHACPVLYCIVGSGLSACDSLVYGLSSVCRLSDIPHHLHLT